MRNNSQLSTSKLQMFLLFLAVGFIGLLSWIFWGLPSASLNSVANSPNETLTVNYVMAKIQSVMSLFSLEGREVNRKFISIDEQGLNSNSQDRGTVRKLLQPNFVDLTKTPAQANKATAAVKAKPAATATKVKTPAKATVATKPARNLEAERKKRLAEWDVYNKKMKDWNDKKAKSEADKKAFEQAHQQQQQYQNTQTASYPTPTTDTSLDDKKPKKSIDEWKQELAAATTPEAARSIIIKLVAAYKNKEVEEIEFYMVVQGYLKSTDDAKKGLGLYALRGTPSYASYLLLVKQQSEFSPALQKYVQETLMSYHQGGLGTLQQALVSKDNQVITKTLEVLKTGIKGITSGNNDGLVDPRYRRDSDFVTFSAKNYLGFAKILEQLGQSGDAQIKSYALEVSGLINAAQASTQPVVASTP